MLAIAIMAVICGTIFEFTNTVVRSSTVSMRADEQEQSFAGLRRLLGTQFTTLPTNETRTFIGVTADGKNGPRDALQVVCPSGNAVLTPDAHGLYRVTLGLHETPHNNGHYSLCLEREPWTDDDDDNTDPAFKLPGVSAGGVKTRSNQLPSDTVRLLDGVRSLEFAYYDPRLNSWQDKWNDDTMLPSLVRVRMLMENASQPYEFIEQVPSGGIRRGLPTTAAVNSTAASGVGIVPGAPGSAVPSLPPGVTVPPPPPGGFPNIPVQMPTTGHSASPR